MNLPKELLFVIIPLYGLFSYTAGYVLGWKEAKNA